MTIKILIFSILILASTHAFAFDGEGLYKACTKKNSQITDELVCTFYIQGVLDTIHIQKSADIALQDICVPKDASSLQKKQIVINYLKNNPTDWKTYASYSIIMAMGQKFPCKKNN